MHFEGQFPVAAPPEKVYGFITNPNSISQCLPDVENLEVIDSTHFKMTVKVGVSFIKAKLNMSIEIAEAQPPSHAKIIARGSGTGSSVDVEATVDLAPAPEGTHLTWKADAKIGGTIAGVGSRLLQGVAEKKNAEFFECIKAKIEAEAKA